MNARSTARVARRKTGFTLIELLIIIACIAVLAALFLPAVRTAGPAARRSACKNNLKQIAIALHNYADEHGSFPPAYTVDAEGRRLHSWRTLILPYMEQRHVYEKIDLSKPWNDPANAAAFNAECPYGFRCPSAVSPENHTTYLAVVTSNSFLQPTSGRGRSTIEENSNQLLVIEVPSSNAVHWMAPIDADESLFLGIGPDSSLSHANGFSAALVSGGVEFLSADMPAAERLRLISFQPRR